MQEKLTHREKEILDLLIGGSSLKDISEALGIKITTVLSHQKRLYRKLGVHSLDELLEKYQTNNGTAPHIPKKTGDKGFSLPKFMIPAGVAVIAVLALVFSFLLGTRLSPEKPPVMPSDQLTVPNPFIIVMGDDSPYGWLYTMEPDLLVYDNEIRASPLKLGKGNRLTEGDLFAVSCTFRSNIDLPSLEFAFVNNTAHDEDGNWDQLSLLKTVQKDIKAGVEYNCAAILSITKTSSNLSGWANTFVIHTDNRTVNQPTLTFKRLDIVRN
jgi:DNA-binding CsgD family transcriptional regulator